MPLSLTRSFIIMILVMSIWLKRNGVMDIIVRIADVRSILKGELSFTGDVRIVSMMRVLQPILFSME
jgi:hypothetical protein